MQANSWHHKLFHFHLSFCIWKVWKGREKLQNFEYLENEKSFFDEIKNIFQFWQGYHLVEKQQFHKKERPQALKDTIKLIKKINLRPPGWTFISSPGFPETIFLALLNPFHATRFSTPPGNIKKPLIFLSFQRV